MFTAMYVDPFRDLALTQKHISLNHSLNPRIRDMLVCLVGSTNQNDRIVTIGVVVNVGLACRHICFLNEFCIDTLFAHPSQILICS